MALDIVEGGKQALALPRVCLLLEAAKCVRADLSCSSRGGRLWRSLKYEEFYLHADDSIPQAREGIRRWMHFYNHRKKHQVLEKRTPDTLYYEHLNAEVRASA